MSLEPVHSMTINGHFQRVSPLTSPTISALFRGGHRSLVSASVVWGKQSMNLSEEQRIVRKSLQSWRPEQPFVKTLPSFQCLIKTYTIETAQSPKRRKSIYLFFIVPYIRSPPKEVLCTEADLRHHGWDLMLNDLWQ